MSHRYMHHLANGVKHEDKMSSVIDHVMSPTCVEQLYRSYATQFVSATG